MSPKMVVEKMNVFASEVSRLVFGKSHGLTNTPYTQADAVD